MFDLGRQDTLLIFVYLLCSFLGSIFWYIIYVIGYLLNACCARPHGGRPWPSRSGVSEPIGRRRCALPSALPPPANPQRLDGTLAAPSPLTGPPHAALLTNSGLSLPVPWRAVWAPALATHGGRTRCSWHSTVLGLGRSSLRSRSWRPPPQRRVCLQGPG